MSSLSSYESHTHRHTHSCTRTAVMNYRARSLKTLARRTSPHGERVHHVGSIPPPPFDTNTRGIERPVTRIVGRRILEARPTSSGGFARTTDGDKLEQNPSKTARRCFVFRRFIWCCNLITHKIIQFKSV